MSQATQYQFELVEVAKLLLKNQQISEGLWTIGVNFGLGAINAGVEPDKIRPAAIIAVEKLMLTRSEEMTPLTVDASKLSEE